MLLRDIKPYIMFITHSLHVYFDHIQMLICSYVTINKTEVHTLWVMDWRMRYCKLTLSFVDCKTVGFFLKISKEIGKGWRKSLTRAKRASLTRPTREVFLAFLASLPRLALCFQPRSRPIVWLLARTWIRKNTDCFAVYIVRGIDYQQSVNTIIILTC